MMKNGIEVRQLTVVRRGRPVLENLDLDIGSGVTGLLGPSGCGKSTLLRSVVGVQKTHGGDVRVFGEPAGSAGLRHRIGYVTQAASVCSGTACSVSCSARSGSGWSSTTRNAG